MSGVVAPSVVRLGIPGLTSLTDSMMSGSLYALVAEAPPTRYPLIASSLASALKQQLPCTVILPGNPVDFIERVGRFGQFDMPKAIAEGQIQIFTVQDNFTKNMFRFGAETFCRELAHFNIPPDSFFIFEQADDLLSLHDVSLAISQVSALKQWFDKQNITGILSFSRIASSATALAALQCLMDQLGGIARIGGHRDGLEVVFDYWSSPEGTVAAKIYPLQALENGMLAVVPQTSGNGSTGGRNGQPDWPEDAEPHFFFMDTDLVSLGKQMPGVWQHVDTLVGMMHATRDTHSSTVILTYRRDTEIRQLAQTVHTLRHALGQRARIVVQEKGASLRYQNEALLLRLGLNLVIHVDVPAGRLPLLLSSLNGQIFDRDIDINFEMALASVSPSGLKGYVQPDRFVNEVKALLERAETLDIPCAMVLGIPARDVSAGDLLAQMLMSRPGDLVSFDQQNCYLFLNSCPESSLLMTLERVLGQGVGAAFVESRFVVRRHEISSELAALTRATERFTLPDYSNLPMRVAAPYKAPAAAEAVAALVMPPVMSPVMPPVIRHQPAAATVIPSAIPEPEPEPVANAHVFKPRQPVAQLEVELDAELAPAPAPAPIFAPTLPPVLNKPLFSPAPVRQPMRVTTVEMSVEKPVEILAEKSAEISAEKSVEMPAEKPAAPSEDVQFRYGGELGKVVAFGKREVPRATRGMKKA